MVHQRWLARAIGAAIWCLPAVCRAESVPHTHDGFYLQMTVGGGYLGTSASDNGEDLSLQGGAISGSFSLGGALVPGFVLGGGTLNSIAFRPKVKESLQGENVDLGNPNAGLQLNMIGMIADFYPNPAKGLHFEAMLGYGVLSITHKGASSVSPSGVGLMAAVGYDFWVSEEWSMGALCSFVYVAAKLNDVNYPTVSPILAASFSYN